MDRIREKTKKNLLKKYWFIIFIPLVLLAFALAASWQSSGYVVERDVVVMDVVKKGNFDILIRASGLLNANNPRWISANSPGRVELLHVEAGDEVKAGEVIVELNNPLLLQQYEETKLQLEAEETEAAAQIVNLDTELEQQRSMLLEADLDFEATAMTFEAQKVLMDQGNATVSHLDFKRSELEVNRYKLRKELQAKHVKMMEKNIDSRKAAITTRVDIMRRTVKSLEQRVEDLKVKAAFDGVIQDLFIELGQELTLGDNIATLSRRDDLIAELQVPEIQIQQVEQDQIVNVDTRSSIIPGRVMRIHPGVTNGTVQVDVKLEGKLPREARSDLSVDGVINIANIEDTLFIKRPVYAQRNTQTRLYKLGSGDDVAELVTVIFGEASADTIQIASGLNVGDKVVVSDTSSWGSHELIRLN